MGVGAPLRGVGEGLGGLDAGHFLVDLGLVPVGVCHLHTGFDAEELRGAEGLHGLRVVLRGVLHERREVDREVGGVVFPA